MLPDIITLLEGYRPFIGAVVFWLGAIVGSFINVVVYRLPRMMERDWHNECARTVFASQVEPHPVPEAFNLALPSSHCPHCQHAIRWWENVPLLSYLFLLGKCSQCGHIISLRYPLVEILTAALSTIVIWQLGLTWAGLSGLLLTWMLVALALIDFDTQLLPDDITMPLLWAGLLVNLFNIHASLNEAVIGAILGYLVLWSVYWLFKLTAGKEGMGFGDFKLLAALGAWLGWQSLPMVILFSSAAGTVIGISMILLHKTETSTPIPFGPYLAVAGWITLVGRESISLHIPFIVL